MNYRAIVCGESMKAYGGKYISFRNNEESVSIANQLVELAGVRAIFLLILGSAALGEARSFCPFAVLDIYKPELRGLDQLGTSS